MATRIQLANLPRVNSLWLGSTSTRTRAAFQPTAVRDVAKRIPAQPKQRSAPEPSTDAGSILYRGMVFADAAAAIALVGVPGPLLKAAGAVDLQDTTVISATIFGLYFIVAAAAAYRLAVAADEDELQQGLYQQLNLTLAVFAVSVSVPVAKAVLLGQLSPSALAGTAAYSVAGALIHGAPYLRLRGADASGPSPAAGVVAALREALSVKRPAASLFYLANFWEVAVLGLALTFGPILPYLVELVKGTGVCLKEEVGLGTLLYASVLWQLLGGSDRGRLGEPSYRALNLACGSVSALVGLGGYIGQQTVDVPYNDTNQTVIFVSCAATTAVYWGLAAWGRGERRDEAKQHEGAASRGSRSSRS